MMKKYMIAGMGGQLGFELARTAPAGVELLAPTEAELDITDRASVAAYVAGNNPAVIINCAAYTAVDKAESEVARAYAVNEHGPKNLAEVSRDHNALLVHISTDFVFDGSQSRPYRPDDQPNPLSIYGKSKLAGEAAILESGAAACIVRTAWLYSAHGNNFVKTMLRLMNERDNLGVVVDQIGTPTWANSLARVIWQLIDKGARGVFHWSDAGVASWYDFAVAIYERGRALGLLDHAVNIRPITASEYPTPATRPGYSVFDKSATHALTGQPHEHWQANLEKMLRELP